MENRQQLVIALLEGKVQVTGPLADKVLCYGLLMAAMDAVREYRGTLNPQLLVPKTQYLIDQQKQGIRQNDGG